MALHHLMCVNQSEHSMIYINQSERFITQVTLLPTLILNTERRDVPLGNRDYLGYGLWAVGFLFEVVADMQKSIFRANPANDVSNKTLHISLYLTPLLFRASSSPLASGPCLAIQTILERSSCGPDCMLLGHQSSGVTSILVLPVLSSSTSYSHEYQV